MIIYAASYSECIEEGGFVPISLHESYKGAQKAIGIHKEKIQKEAELAGVEIQEWQQWKIIENELLA